MAEPQSTQNRSAHAMRRASWLLVLCGMILGFDVGGELHAAYLYPQSYTGVVLFHLTLEIAASFGLGWVFVLTRAELRRANQARKADNDKLRALRGSFDDLLQQRFQDWQLSQAEADIALLTVRGLKIAEIATIRNTREGTVKSQLSTIFRKSGVSTRTEFLARFIDEFLDHSTREAAIV